MATRLTVGANLRNIDAALVDHGIWDDRDRRRRERSDVTPNNSMQLTPKPVRKFAARFWRS